MKFNLNKGTVTLTSETQDEALILFALATREMPPVENVEKRPRKKSVKTCEICHKGFTGLKGLGVHKSSAHGVKTKNSEKNHAYYLRRKAEAVNAPTVERSVSDIWR